MGAAQSPVFRIGSHVYDGAADYLLNYMLDVESRGSLLSVDDFKKPFDYEMNIAVDSAGAYERRKVDLHREADNHQHLRITLRWKHMKVILIQKEILMMII